MYTSKITLVMILDQLIVSGMFSSEFLMVLVPFEARSERVRDTLLKRLLIIIVSSKNPSFCGSWLRILVGIVRSEGASETKMIVLSDDYTVSHNF